MNEKQNSPLIVAFVADLMFGARIGSVAQQVGFQVEWIENAAKFGDEDAASAKTAPGESLHGQAGRLFDQLTRWQPALLLFDLANADIPWRDWIPRLKGSPATRRIPVLCFGPHVDVASMQEAKDFGADTVLPRSRLAADMPNLLRQHARTPDFEALTEACSQPLSALALQGIALHNQGDYFEAHEVLEHAWVDDETPARSLYQGLLQVSVAFLQIKRGNYRGAVKMCLRLRQWLEPLPDTCRGVDVEAVRLGIEQVHQALVALGPSRIDEFDRSLFQPFNLK